MVSFSRVLDPPRYGFLKEGRFYRPTQREILREFFHRLNVLRDRRQWLPLVSWFFTLSLAVPLSAFLFFHFSWPLVVAGFVYSMVVMGSYGTFWLHRYGTHQAFRFRNSVTRFLCRNAVIKIVPEEAYIVSHHVHHWYSEKPGDPYNVDGGWLYCFLADVNHQAIARDLSEREYLKVRQLIAHTGVRMNSYAQYQRWGSICHPGWTVLHYVANWAFWYGVFFLLGGHALATALFGAAGVWGIGIRTFNFDGHGRGLNKQRDGIDFYRADRSINQVWAGYVAGEWHNNHHLYPRSARCGFQPYQLDLPWLAVSFLNAFGQVSAIRDDKADFIERFYKPYLRGTHRVVRASIGGVSKQPVAEPA